MPENIANSPPPWADSKVGCVGWIPNADGHLSFSLIGLGTHKSCRRYTARFLLGADANFREMRKVACFQKRHNADIPFLVRLFQPESRHYWLMTGETRPARYCNGEDGGNQDIHDDQGMLLGEIRVFPHQELLFVREVKQAIMDKIRNSLHSSRRGDLAEVFEELEAQKRRAELEKIDTVSVNFALFRTGEVHLWLKPEESTKLELPANVDLVELPITGEKRIAYAGTPDMSLSETILSQAFYYLKDITHFHVHHDGAADQILPAVFRRAEDDNENGQPSVLELRWQRETLWAMSRAIDEFVRTNGRENLRNALGLICFAESFQTVIAGRVRNVGSLNKFASPAVNLHRYDFKSLRESVKISLERISWKLAAHIAMAGSVIAVALSSITMVNSLAGAKATVASSWFVANPLVKVGFSTQSQRQLWPSSLVDWIHDYPFTIPAFSIFLLLAGYFFIFSEANFLRTIFAVETNFGKFVHSHVRWGMKWYRGRKQGTIIVALISASFLSAIAGLAFVMHLLVPYLPNLK